MKITKKIYGTALKLKCNLADALKVQNLYIANLHSGAISEYTTSRSTVNALLISWLEEARFDIAITQSSKPSCGIRRACMRA